MTEAEMPDEADLSSFTADEAFEIGTQSTNQTVAYFSRLLAGDDIDNEDASSLFDTYYDASLYADDLDVMASRWHRCQREVFDQLRSAAETANIDISGIDIEIEMVDSARVDDDTHALSLRTTTRIGGLPDSVSVSAVLVTSKGAGPTLFSQAPDPCADTLALSARGSALATSGLEVLGLGSIEPT